MTVTIDDIRAKTIEEAAVIIKSANRKRLADVTIFDLILNVSGQHPYLHGVYMIFSKGGDSILYIGRVQGPQFIERFPSHFALGTRSWQNQFLKHHWRETKTPDLAAAAIGASDCELLLLLSDPLDAARLEALWIRFLRPAYNRTKPTAGLAASFPEGATIESLLETRTPQEVQSPH